MSEDGKQFVKALLNRNPKHRLGSQRGAEELKEHPFFTSIDWELLAARQIPPPFKPFVDSDESVANFDPEFTEANIWDEVPEDAIFDDNDPSADWLNAATTNGGSGTLSRTGSRKASINHAQQQPGAVAIKGQPKRPAGAPLSSSVQENFRGFTFSGENDSMIHQAAAKLSMTTLDSTSRRLAGGGDGNGDATMTDAPLVDSPLASP